MNHPFYWKWTRRCKEEQEAIWRERLKDFDTRVVSYRSPNKSFTRFEIYCDTASQAKALRTRWKGSISKIDMHTLTQTPASLHPIKIRHRLVIISSPAQATSIPSEKRLIIPSGMAFGTGEHTTTATCLRILCDLLPSLPSPWKMLDLGTGSGILGLAALKWGAQSVTAIDHDPACVRTAKENAQQNQIKNLIVQKQDVLSWNPSHTYPLITANLYSEILIRSAPQIARALPINGFLIFSGILRTQEAACKQAFKNQEISILRTHPRGKWVAILAKKSSQPFPKTPKEK